MGISPFSKTSKCAVGEVVRAPVPASNPIASGNPNPKRFKILRMYWVEPWTACEVQYPDATNYEGRKIMIYRSSPAVIQAAEVLDPHFCDDGSHLSPFARFAPTGEGWAAAMQFVHRQ